MNLSLMRNCLKLDQNMSGYGLQSIQKNRQILALSISKERHMFVAERFIFDLVKVYGKHSISTDGERTWYP